MSGREVHIRGRFFELDGAVRPAPPPPIPILVGGRANAALKRPAELGEGWLAVWVSPRRFEEAVARIDAWGRPRRAAPACAGDKCLRCRQASTVDG